MSELMDFVKEFTGEGGSLPLVHTTDKFTLQLIKQSRQLKTDDDKVYEAKNCYIFFMVVHLSAPTQMLSIRPHRFLRQFV